MDLSLTLMWVLMGYIKIEKIITRTRRWTENDCSWSVPRAVATSCHPVIIRSEGGTAQWVELLGSPVTGEKMPCVTIREVTDWAAGSSSHLTLWDHMPAVLHRSKVISGINNCDCVTVHANVNPPDTHTYRSRVLPPSPPCHAHRMMAWQAS